MQANSRILFFKGSSPLISRSTQSSLGTKLRLIDRIKIQLCYLRYQIVAKRCRIKSTIFDAAGNDNPREAFYKYQNNNNNLQRYQMQMTQTIAAKRPSASQSGSGHQTNGSNESSVSPYEHIMDQLKTEDMANNLQSNIKQFNLYGAPFYNPWKDGIFIIKQLEDEQSSVINWNMHDNISTIKNNPIHSFLVYDVSNSDIEVNEWLLASHNQTHLHDQQKTPSNHAYVQQKLQQTAFANPLQYFFNTSSGHVSSNSGSGWSKAYKPRLSTQHSGNPCQCDAQQQQTIKKGIDLIKRRSRR